MKVLELFSGTESFSKVARERGHDTFTVDNNPRFKSDLCLDIMNLKASDIPFKPDVIWASPPCRTFSIASCYRHWNKDRTPKTDDCLKGIAMLKKAIELIIELNPRYWFIENPRGLMRKQEIMKDLPKNTVTYCQYGSKVMKPTDIWTNCSSWIPKPMCKNGMPCHESAKRGSDRGTQAQHRSPMLRAIIPPDLCKEIILVCEKELMSN